MKALTSSDEDGKPACCLCPQAPHHFNLRNAPLSYLTILTHQLLVTPLVLPACLPTCLHVYLLICLSACPSAWLPTYPPACSPGPQTTLWRTCWAAWSTRCSPPTSSTAMSTMKSTASGSTRPGNAKRPPSCWRGEDCELSHMLGLLSHSLCPSPDPDFHLHLFCF